jgi:hypothetical protein
MQVKVRHCDVFNEPADVAVLPCSATGELKDFARATRRDQELPPPPHELALGNIQLLPLSGARLHVRYLAYAAARDGRGSSLEVVSKLGARLGDLTHQDGIQVIASPLLGTGAGEVPLVAAVEAIVEGFRKRAIPSATLVLCAPRAKTFEVVKDWYGEWRRRLSPPRVFLSYNQATQAEFVTALYAFLKGQGIDAVVDRWQLPFSTDLKRWMLKQVARAERVIIVTDEEYARKADALEGGVGDETTIIRADLRSAPDGKYVVVVRAPALTPGMPHYLKGRYVLHCASMAEAPSICQKVLRGLYDDSAFQPSPGEPPLFVKDDRHGESEPHRARLPPEGD